MTDTHIEFEVGHPLRHWQEKCASRRERFQVYALHRRAGKTELALMRLIESALVSDKDLPLFYYVAPFQNQAVNIAWSRLKALIEPLIEAKVVKVNETSNFVEFANGAVLRVMGADKPHVHRGIRLDGVCIDEVAQIKPEVWEDVLMPALSDRLGWAMFIGTPNGVNLFSELYYKGKTEEGWHSDSFTVYDTEALDKMEIERLRRDMSDDSFAREYLCDFSAAGDEQVIPLADAEAASKRVILPQDIELSPKILGVDPARFGGDRSVIFPRQGLLAMKPQVYTGVDNMTLAAYVAQVILDWKPDAVFIDSGAGSGIIDRLRQLGHQITEVNFGGKPDQPNQFLNKRAEMWWRIREWLKMGGAIPDDYDLKQDLAAPIYWYDAKQHIQLEPKDDIKKRGLRSPDMADALALTFAYPVAPRPHPLFGGNRSDAGNRRDYDPYNNLKMRR